MLFRSRSGQWDREQSERDRREGWEGARERERESCPAVRVMNVFYLGKGGMFSRRVRACARVCVCGIGERSTECVFPPALSLISTLCAQLGSAQLGASLVETLTFTLTHTHLV